MRPSISEFSYGYAVTSELIGGWGGVTAAPIFPSTHREGQPGGGWDVQLDRPGFPLFLQFKLCHKMTRRSCREVKKADFKVPCYRMYLRPRRLSRQHEMLIELEQTHHEVFYIAPMFHQSDELDDAFRQQLVCARSQWIRPSDIGELLDNSNHHVSFEPRGRWMVFSEPKLIDATRQFDDVVTQMRVGLRERGRIDLSRDHLERLAATVTRIANRKHSARHRQRDVQREDASRAELLQRIANHASVFLESHLFVVQE